MRRVVFGPRFALKRAAVSAGDHRLRAVALRVVTNVAGAPAAPTAAACTMSVFRRSRRDVRACLYVYASQRTEIQMTDDLSPCGAGNTDAGGLRATGAGGRRHNPEGSGYFQKLRPDGFAMGVLKFLPTPFRLRREQLQQSPRNDRRRTSRPAVFVVPRTRTRFPRGVRRRAAHPE